MKKITPILAPYNRRGRLLFNIRVFDPGQSKRHNLVNSKSVSNIADRWRWSPHHYSISCPLRRFSNQNKCQCQELLAFCILPRISLETTALKWFNPCLFCRFSKENHVNVKSNSHFAGRIIGDSRIKMVQSVPFSAMPNAFNNVNILLNLINLKNHSSILRHKWKVVDEQHQLTIGRNLNLEWINTFLELEQRTWNFKL